MSAIGGERGAGMGGPCRRSAFDHRHIHGGVPGSRGVSLHDRHPDALWSTEVWEDAESHRASLALPAVQEAIVKGRPLIAGFSNRVETMLLGGLGLERRVGR